MSHDCSSVLVAIKTLKENATAKTRQDFHREVELMTDLRHPNIVCLLGVVMKEEPMCMLFEHMSQVSTKNFRCGNVSVTVLIYLKDGCTGKCGILLPLMLACLLFTSPAMTKHIQGSSSNGNRKCGNMNLYIDL